MALFFDQAWFDGKLADKALSRQDLSRHLDLSDSDIDLMWRDQREIAPHEVRLMAELLGEDMAEIASRAGVSTPTPADLPDSGSNDQLLAALIARFDEMNGRLQKLERSVSDLKTLIRDQNDKPK